MKKVTVQKTARSGISAFAEQIAAGLEEAIAFERGSGPARVVTVEVPAPAPDYRAAEVVKIRTKLGLSQCRFAELMNVSVKSIEGWEAGKKRPGPSSRRLLQLASDHQTLQAMAKLQGYRLVR